MIHEEICTYEVCKLAKEKGFPQHIGDDAYIVENEYDDEYEVGYHYPIQFIPDYLPTITAPTQSLLQRWLREEKKIYVYIVPYNIAGEILYIGRAIAPKQDDELIPRFSDTYELALEDALKLALGNLA